MIYILRQHIFQDLVDVMNRKDFDGRDVRDTFAYIRKKRVALTKVMIRNGVSNLHILVLIESLYVLARQNSN